MVQEIRASQQTASQQPVDWGNLSNSYLTYCSFIVAVVITKYGRKKADY